MFSDQQGIPFLGTFGSFFHHNSRKYSQILLKFGTVMQTNILHHIYYGFDIVLKNRRNWPKNLILWLEFRSFWTTPSFAVWVSPQFLSKRKVSWRYTILVSFIFIACVVVELYIFKVSRTRKNGDFGLLLGGFW